ncbi:hypothetical protein MWU54_16850 [Marivita sp. S6314]|uniref:hypothetical protein n=1 Tax=Marivita sp. S6314 TaxID=2926406 RepID=UPI001FF15BAA|nr:hypothetical protein [Marivita sp. S6314]MCK0151714.1 hypothetical protein [Marivita sp. S6314]
MNILHLAARHGRFCLVAGLIGGAALPGLAAVLRPWLPELVALLLFLTALRVGPRTAFGSLRDVRQVGAYVCVLQVLAPLSAIAVFSLLGLLSQPFVLAVVLMLSAPSVTGAPNFLIMVGKDPSYAMRILVLGTAMFPVTVIPVLWALPLADPVGVIAAAGRLIAVILGATAVGFAVRHVLWRDLDTNGRSNLDGLSALALAVIVVGLMSEIGPLLRSAPMILLSWALAVMVLNFGLQLFTFAVLKHTQRPEVPALSIISGNRNIALFLIALPPEVTGPLLVFIGCYQIPMYLTPLVLRRFYASSG